MKLERLILVFMLAISAFMVSCNSDDDTPNQSAIVGLWTYDSYSMDVKVNGKDMITYLIEDMQMDPSLAEIYKNVLAGSFASDEEFQGSTIRFNANGTFESTDPDGSKESGTYELKDNGKTLVTTSSDGVTEFEVKTLNNSQMVLAYSETSEEDLNDDGINDVLLVDLIMTFRK